jgi:hypothetical protein
VSGRPFFPGITSGICSGPRVEVRARKAGSAEYASGRKRELLPVDPLRGLTPFCGSLSLAPFAGEIFGSDPFFDTFAGGWLAADSWRFGLSSAAPFAAAWSCGFITEFGADDSILFGIGSTGFFCSGVEMDP